MIFIVDEREKGKRLDKFLAEKVPEISRTVLGRLVEEGHVRVDGVVAAKKIKVSAGQSIEFNLPSASTAGMMEPESMPLDILYEDDDLVVVNKAPGICVHPAPGHLTGTLVNGLLALYPEMALVGSIKRPGVVHRIDLDTSGSIVFARTPLAYQGLTGLIVAKRIKREYLALVHGIPELASATINMPIGRDPLFRRRFTVTPTLQDARHAITHFDVIEKFQHGSRACAALLRVRLETGRTHQIRVHMRKIGHPICGDHVYAREWKEFPIARQALHAHTLAFPHPRTGQEISVTAPIPEDFGRLLDFFRLGC